jgi:glutamate-5-semialdehyde dehydrogenase
MQGTVIRGCKKMNYIEVLGTKAKECKGELASASSLQKNEALMQIAHVLRRSSAEIKAANALDLKAAAMRGMSESLQDRLRLDEKRIEGMAQACEKLCVLTDPVGEVLGGEVRPNGMKIQKVRVPMGVIGIIYEARPNVTADAAALCLKSGNAVILRGGKEALNSNLCLVNLMRRAVKLAGFPEDIIQLVEDTDRGIALEMMQANGYIDVLIPRGGAKLIQTVVKNATVPVIETGTGNCHVYVDASADLDMAVNIVDNGKTQRPSVCNAVESCLVHRNVAEDFLPLMKKRLDEHNVEIRGCEITRMILGEENVRLATEEDYATEFLDYIISVKVVDSLREAIEHIGRYSTGHSECIVTESLFSAEEFQKRVDSAAVYVNCSTRFTDGDEFGLGAEIGISTQKLHARGPMGLRELTTMKWLINGSGQIRK